MASPLELLPYPITHRLARPRPRPSPFPLALRCLPCGFAGRFPACSDDASRWKRDAFAASPHSCEHALIVRMLSYRASSACSAESESERHMHRFASMVHNRVSQVRAAAHSLPISPPADAHPAI